MSLTLYYSPTSPFARKVRIALLELDLDESVERIAINPFEAGADFHAINPLSKVPTLVAEQGIALPDSKAILDYLIALAAESGRGLHVDLDTPWAWRRRLQLADGAIDAAVAANLEQRREAILISGKWFDRHVSAVNRALDAVESEAEEFRSVGAIGLTEIAAISALGYLDLRLPQLEWRSGRAALADWADRLAARPSVVLTEPPTSV